MKSQRKTLKKVDRVKLVCFPHAGGGALYYNKWNKIFSENIEFYAMQYPMRENQINKDMPDSISELAKMIFQEHKEIFEGKYAVWGHSMGSVVGYEVAKLCQEIYGNSPIVFFSSGAAVPCNMSKKAIDPLITDRKLIDTLLSYGGVDKNMLEMKEFCEYYLPIIRKDMELISKYHDAQKKKLICPIVILNGTEDEVDVNQWQEYSDNEVTFEEFIGGHFFINDYQYEVSELIKKYIEIEEMKKGDGEYEYT